MYVSRRPPPPSTPIPQQQSGRAFSLVFLHFPVTVGSLDKTDILWQAALSRRLGGIQLARLVAIRGNLSKVNCSMPLHYAQNLCVSITLLVTALYKVLDINYTVTPHLSVRQVLGIAVRGELSSCMFCRPIACVHCVCYKLLQCLFPLQSWHMEDQYTLPCSRVSFLSWLCHSCKGAELIFWEVGQDITLQENIMFYRSRRTLSCL